MSLDEAIKYLDYCIEQGLYTREDIDALEIDEKLVLAMHTLERTRMYSAMEDGGGEVN